MAEQKRVGPTPGLGQRTVAHTSATADALSPCLVLCRAALSDPEGAHAQVKIGPTEAPTEATLAQCHEAIIDIFRKGFGCDPDRVAVVVLPWIEEEDGDPQALDGEDEEC